MGAVCRHLQKRGDKHEKRKIQGSYQSLSSSNEMRQQTGAGLQK